jgi:hypothetical protein
MKQEQIKEDGEAPVNVTAGVEGTKLPIKPADVFKRVQLLKKKNDKRVRDGA